MPVRVTEQEARLLFGDTSTTRPPSDGKRRTRTKKEKAALPENQVESAILGFLRSRGWIVDRQPAGVTAGIGPLLAALDRNQPITRELLYRCMIRSGAKGRADWVAVRPVAYVDAELARKHPGMVQRFEMEIKAEGKKPSPEQRKYLEDRAAVGFLCGWFDSFEDDGFESATCFERWYSKKFGGR